MERKQRKQRDIFTQTAKFKIDKVHAFCQGFTALIKVHNKL